MSTADEIDAADARADHAGQGAGGQGSRADAPRRLAERAARSSADPFACPGSEEARGCLATAIEYGRHSATHGVANGDERIEEAAARHDPRAGKADPCGPTSPWAQAVGRGG